MSGWHYTAALNFYRWMSQEGSIVPEIRDGNPAPVGDVYVLHSLLDAETIEKRQLKVVYKGDFTDIVVAIPPAPH